MSSMKSVRTGAVHQVEVVDVRRPVPGLKDVLVRSRACGICAIKIVANRGICASLDEQLHHGKMSIL